MAAAQLKVLQLFAVNGVEYAPDTLVPAEHPASWPEGSLVRRLENGFVEYVAVEEPDGKAEKAKK